MKERRRFKGSGPVYDYFGNYICDASSQTVAVSDKKAWSNMLCQIKKDMGLAPNAFLRWDAKIVPID